jgi:hypothetical protein
MPAPKNPSRTFATIAAHSGTAHLPRAEPAPRVVEVTAIKLRVFSGWEKASGPASSSAKPNPRPSIAARTASVVPSAKKV